MRCSSCEPLLDAYLETTLRPAQARQVAAHLSACGGCDALLAELRVIDALLATASSPAPFDSDFTAGVLSAARSSTPATVRRRIPYWLSLLAYLAVAWVAALIAAVRWHDLGWPLGDLWQSQVHGFAAFGAVVRTLAPATPLAAAAVTVSLAGLARVIPPAPKLVIVIAPPLTPPADSMPVPVVPFLIVPAPPIAKGVPEAVLEMIEICPPLPPGTFAVTETVGEVKVL